MQQMRDEFTAAATDSVKTTSDHTRALAEGIGALKRPQGTWRKAGRDPADHQEGLVQPRLIRPREVPRGT